MDLCKCSRIQFSNFLVETIQKKGIAQCTRFSLLRDLERLRCTQPYPYFVERLYRRLGPMTPRSQWSNQTICQDCKKDRINFSQSKEPQQEKKRKPQQEKEFIKTNLLRS